MYAFKRGQTSVILRVKLLDSSVSTGAGKTGLSSSSSGLIISTIADNESSATAYTQAGSTIESISTLGTYATPTSTKCRFKEVDSTNHPGVYEIQLDDARFAVSSAKSLLISISGVTNLAQCDLLVRLLDMDPYDAVRAGLTALPNANAEAAGGLYTRGSGAGQITQDANGRINVNVKAFGDSAGTFSGGRPEVNVTHAAGTAWGSGAITAGSIAASALNGKGDWIASSTVIEGTYTWQQCAKLWNAAAAGKADGMATTTVHLRDLGDTKDRITGTVDADGNRSAITIDVS